MRRGQEAARSVSSIREHGRRTHDAKGPRPGYSRSFTAKRKNTIAAIRQTAATAAMETRRITVERPFPDFETFWESMTSSPSLRALVESVSPAQRETVLTRLREVLPADATGAIRYAAHANAVRGRLPG